MPKYKQVDYSYAVREQGTLEDIFVEDAADLDVEVAAIVEDMFRDSGDKITDIRVDAYVEDKE